MKIFRILWPFAAAAASGALLSLSYAPPSVEGLAWVWMIPLLWALWFGPARDPLLPLPKIIRRASLLGYLAGSVFFLINLSWLHTVSSLGAILLPLYLAFYFAAFAAFAATIGRPRDSDLVPLPPASTPNSQIPASGKGAPLFLGSFQNLKFAFFNAAAWTSIEWLRGVLFTGFSWNGLGVALHENLLLIQVADIVGVTGLSFLLMFCGCIATGTLRRIQVEFGNRAVRPHLDFAVAVILVILVFFYGLRQVDRGYEDPVSLRTLIVQLNIPITEKWNPANADESYKAYEDYTRLFTDIENFDLVLWPETALYHPFFQPETQSFLNRILATGNFHLLLGTEEVSPPSSFYNSVALLRGSTRDPQLHRKVHLVPFGEYIPLRNAFPPFVWIAGDLIPGDFSRGTSHAPLKLEEPEVELIPLVCFEDTLGNHVRRFASPNTQLIVNVTNDGWFLESAAASQHLANARFRCVELKRPMARAANTGVSCFIDHVGSLYNRTTPGQNPRLIHDSETGSHFVRGCLKDTLKIPRQPPLTLYARYGDAFSHAMLAFVAALIAIRTLRRLRPKPTEGDAEPVPTESESSP